MRRLCCNISRQVSNPHQNLVGSKASLLSHCLFCRSLYAFNRCDCRRICTVRAIRTGPFVIRPMRIEVHFSFQMCANLASSTTGRLITSAAFQDCPDFASQHGWVGSDVLLHIAIARLAFRPTACYAESARPHH